MAKMISISGIALFSLLLAAAAPADELIVNGGFEQNTGLGNDRLTGWSILNEGSGGWFAQMGTKPAPASFDCAGSLTVPRPPSGFAAMTTQRNPGSHILYQDVAIPAASTAVLSFDLYLNSFDDFATPDTLDHRQRPNQQFRVDVLDPAAPANDVHAGVLANLYQTHPGDPTESGYTHLAYDLSPLAGRTVRLRFAEIDSGNCFSAGVDDVSLTTTPLAAPRAKHRSTRH